MDSQHKQEESHDQNSPTIKVETTEEGGLRIKTGVKAGAEDTFTAKGND